MAPIFFCCGFRRPPSPESEPVHLADRTERFALSSHTASVNSFVDVQPIHEIFASASNLEDNDETARTSSQHAAHARSTMPHRGSSSRLHEVASKVRSQMSRDSGMEKRDEKRKLKSRLSQEDVERRWELKRALVARVKTDLEDENSVYDEDAVPIKTPAATWARHKGEAQDESRYMEKATKISDSRFSMPFEGSRVKSLEKTGVKEEPAATTLSRMLTQRASQTTGDSEDLHSETMADVPQRKLSTQKYIFEEAHETPKREMPTRPTSPLDRMNTVIRIKPSNKPKRTELLEGEDLLKTLPPSIRDLQHIRLASISDSVSRSDGRLSVSEKRGDSLPVELLDSRQRPAPGAISSGVFDTIIRPASEQWLRGASGLLSPSLHQKNLSEEHNPQPRQSHHCDPSSEEQDFGGIDGEDNSLAPSGYLTARSSQDWHEHIYNQHVPRRLASRKSLLPAASLPQLQNRSRQLSYDEGDSGDFSVNPSYTDFSTNLSRQVSSPLMRPPPLAWDNATGPRACSSVYSSHGSPGESLLSSRRSSLGQGTALSNRLQQSRVQNRIGESLSIYPSHSKHLDVERLEHATHSTSYHSSHESLTKRELAAAETRIASRPNYGSNLPKSSNFIEDLRSISAEIELSNPRKRASYRSGLNGSGFDGSDDQHQKRVSIVPPGLIGATNIWERALWMHEEEDERLKRTRLGSSEPGSVYGSVQLGEDADEGPLGKRALSSRPSLRRAHDRSYDIITGEHLHPPDLQATLAAYQLPAPPPPSPRTPEPERGRSQMSGGQRGGKADAWCRYPSFERAARSESPAGEADHVKARDFADLTPRLPSAGRELRVWRGVRESGNGLKSKKSFRDMLGRVKHVYRSQSAEVARRLRDESRGHRSSVSAGVSHAFPVSSYKCIFDLS